MSPRRCSAPVRIVASLIIVAGFRIATPASADPTPPAIVLDRADATGPIVHFPGGPIEFITVPITDPPGETIPARARIEFRWHGEPAADVAGYRYRLTAGNGGGVGFTEVDSSVHGVDFIPGVADSVLQPGNKVFTLQVVDHDGWTREVIRRFQLGRTPDTWFAGPDLAILDPRFGWTGPPRWLSIADWNDLPDLSGSLLSCDSLTRRPGERPVRRTFFEIYGDRLYVRSEGDTVHLNSRVVLHGGGFDMDSPYQPVVEPGDPALADTLECLILDTPWAVRPDGLVGSPIGFRFNSLVELDPTGVLQATSQSRMFPNFDIASVLRLPVIGAYTVFNGSGRAFVWLKAEDADGQRDQSIGDARAIVAAVEAGTATPEQIALRPKILTFFVNHAPYLRFENPAFVPEPGHAFADRSLDLHLSADDVDPFDLSSAPGGPSSTKVLRWNIALLGKTVDGRDTTVAPLAAPVFTPDISLEVPAVLVDPRVTIRVELCDCADCGTYPGSGRCVTYDIPVTVGEVVGIPEPVVPRRLELALDGMRPNPWDGGDGLVRFSLAGTGRARLELLDISGRRLVLRNLNALGPGRHEIRLEPGVRLAAGVYLLRLTEGSVSRTRRAAVIR